MDAADQSVAPVPLGPEANYAALTRYCQNLAEKGQAQFDLKNAAKEDFDFVPPVPPVDWSGIAVAPTLNQGDPTKFATCVAFAIAAVITDIHTKLTGKILQVSPDHIHHCLGGLAETQSADPLTLLSQILHQNLTVWSSLEPYPYTLPSCQHPHVALQVSNYSPAGVPMMSTKQYLSQQPLIGFFAVPNSFWTFKGNSFQDASPPTSYHCMELLGWDTGHWIVRNSLGPGWGTNGFARLAFGTCATTSDGPLSGTLGLQISGTA